MQYQQCCALILQFADKHDDAIGHLLALDSMQARGIDIVSIETAFA
ncbi:hypothetical protein [Alteromonas sp. 07-89-2]|jgi:hypothetical protein|nr:hypothetical protein [Alteromonas sp. 07-89-2]